MGYTRMEGIERLNDQFNIMALVGNGFDIQVLDAYGQEATTRYTDFYRFLEAGRIDPSNLLFNEMRIARDAGFENWSDVEERVAQLAGRGESVPIIRASLDVIRENFSEFLNTVVSSPLLSKLNIDAQSHEWSKSSLSGFLRDLKKVDDLHKVPFGMLKSNHDLYNFYFVNFNYSSLLDNYLFLDSEQFKVRPHSSSETNFIFDADPRGFSSDTWNYASYGYVETHVAHPHGFQDIPRSLLFGTDWEGDPRSDKAQLAKPYWARSNTRYSHLFPDTHLFIIFGSSLGATDAWWWKKIAQSLIAQRDKALIIYWWGQSPDFVLDSREIISKFFDSASVEESKREALLSQIAVVAYADVDDRVWLSMKTD